jgi:uncharacterized protein (DUF433 family)
MREIKLVSKNKTVMIDVQEIIKRNPSKILGSPSIKEIRISFNNVSNWFANGMSFDYILLDVPELNKNHHLAYVDFATKNSLI